jgi:hypothetical protein
MVLNLGPSLVINLYELEHSKKLIHSDVLIVRRFFDQ